MEYFGLPQKHREILVLRVAGQYSDEAAKILGHRKVDTDHMFADVLTRLYEAQQGEQISTDKLLGAEIDSCFSMEIMEYLA
jgi:hypothetical protein